MVCPVDVHRTVIMLHESSASEADDLEDTIPDVAEEEHVVEEKVVHRRVRGVTMIGSQSIVHHATPTNNKWYQDPKFWSFSVSLFYTTMCGVSVSFAIWVGSAMLAWALDKKFDIMIRILDKHGIGALVGSYALSAAFFGGLSSGICYMFGKVIAGSGLPQLISYISCGFSKQESLMTMKLVVLKSLSLVAAILSGLSIGREGPCVHIGAVVALNVGRWCRNGVQRILVWYPWVNTKLEILQVGDFTAPFSGEFEHEVIHIGASAGFASSFGAPLGGYLFIYEEVSSHWPQQAVMGARVITGAAVAVGFTQLLHVAFEANFEKEFESVIIYDISSQSLTASWFYADIPFFLLTGICTGILSGILHTLGQRVNAFHSTFKTKEKKLVMAITVAVFTGVALAGLPAIAVSCSTLPSEEKIQDFSGRRRFVQFNNCEEGEYNEMASLTMGSAEDMVRHMFSRDEYTFSMVVLTTFVVVYGLTFVSALGVFVPAGSFVPNLIMGAAVGRVFADVAHHSYGGYTSRGGDTDIHISSSGVFALIGASSSLCSWTRCLPAIIVSMFEITADVTLTIPIVVTSILSTSVASYFSEVSWTHHQIRLARLPHHKVPPKLWTDRLLDTHTELIERGLSVQNVRDSHVDSILSNPMHPKNSALVAPIRTPPVLNPLGSVDTNSPRKAATLSLSQSQTRMVDRDSNGSTVSNGSINEEL